MNRKLLILFLLMSILGLIASIYVAVVFADTSSYVLVGLFLFSALFFLFQRKNYPPKSK